MMSAHDERQMRFCTDDGTELVGDLSVPTSCAAAAVVCHPHPQFGGNRFNPVVDAVHRSLPEVGVASLRFDFRERFGERLDAEAALVELRRAVPDVPVVAIGYSFGAMVAMSVHVEDLAARILIAPPLGRSAGEPNRICPTLVLTPAHDQFAPPEVAGPIVEAWPDAEFQVIDIADHFLAGRTSTVADRVAAWVSDRWPPRSLP